MKWVYLALYVGCVFVANWAITIIGIIPVGFGVAAPAGVLFAGVALTLRDLLQDAGGKRYVIVAIIIGSAISALLSGSLAVASGVAFLLSELLDFAVYTPLRGRNWVAAVIVSNAAGLIIDSVVFLSLAFGSLEYLPGQIIGKVYATVGAIAILFIIRKMQ